VPLTAATRVVGVVPVVGVSRIKGDDAVAENFRAAPFAPLRLIV
jgi:hypothetical protein